MHFRDKVGGIRRSTLSAPPAVVEPRSAAMLSPFQPVASAEISKIIMNSAKQCGLDPAATWLVKQFYQQRASSIDKMCNASFREEILAKNQKHPIVRPRLKKGITQSGRPERIQADIQLVFRLEDHRARGRGEV